MALKAVYKRLLTYAIRYLSQEVILTKLNAHSFNKPMIEKVQVHFYCKNECSR